MYILYSTRGRGWLTKSSTYTSDRTQAKQFTKEEMLDICVVHYQNGMTEFGLLPISMSDLSSIAKAGR